MYKIFSYIYKYLTYKGYFSLIKQNYLLSLIVNQKVASGKHVLSTDIYSSKYEHH